MGKCGLTGSYLFPRKEESHKRKVTGVQRIVRIIHPRAGIHNTWFPLDLNSTSMLFNQRQMNFIM